MADSFVQTTHVGCFSRLIESIKGVAIGLVLLLVSVIALFWGEGRAVHRAQALAEGKSAVVNAESSHVDPADEGKLVHLTGEAVSKNGLEDSEYGVPAPGALRLKRSVEMYQWKENERTETRKNLGGSEDRVTTYSYEKVWSGAHLNSANYKQSGHGNPPEIPIPEKTWNAADATLGAYKLNDVVLEKLSPNKPVTPPASAVETSAKTELGSHAKPVIAQEKIYFGDPGSPSIGDVRLSFTQLPSGPMSVVAKQIHDTFEPYSAKTDEVLLVQSGTFSADAMFKQAEEENALITWLIRGGGFLLLVIGFSLIFAPFATIADVVPFIGSIVGAGTFMAALVCAMPVWLVTVAVAWIVYRPLLGLAMLVVGIAIPIAFMVLRKPAPKSAPVPAA